MLHTHGVPEVPGQNFLTIDEVAAEYRVSTRTIRRLVADGKLPAFHIGRSVRLSREQVNAMTADPRWRDREHV